MVINRMTVLARWKSVKILSQYQSQFTHLSALCMQYKQEFYDPVEAATGIPWYVVAAIDMREESFNHTGYLGNGDPLWKPTTNVPRGRGPFSSWFAGAIDALQYDAFTPAKGEGSHWDIVTALIALENYNGQGYAEQGIASPYIWSLTTLQVPGKFVADGSFDPGAMDSQPGCAGLLLTLQSQGIVVDQPPLPTGEQLTLPGVL